MCKGVKSAPAIPPLHTDIYFKEMVVPTPVPNYNVNISIMMKKKNCLWSVLCSYFSRTTPEVWLEADRDPLFQGVSARFLGVHQGSYSSIHTYSNEPN